ncbi:MAG: hypothetical protein RLZZ516_1682 [Cyanobacteriota bacterium]
MHYREELESGRDAFGHLIKAWHERNGWSQRVLPALAERLDLGRVHNSQLSNLRNRKLASPGPELFVALLAQQPDSGALSTDLQEQLADQPELLTALQTSAVPLLSDTGEALGPAQLFEIFVGMRPLPTAFDLRVQEQESGTLSAALAQLFTAGESWRACRDQVLAAYPVEKRQRRERFAEVMTGLRDYTAAELELELPELVVTARQLGLAEGLDFGGDALLDLLRTQPAAVS